MLAGVLLATRLVPALAEPEALDVDGLTLALVATDRGIQYAVGDLDGDGRVDMAVFTQQTERLGGGRTIHRTRIDILHGRAAPLARAILGAGGETAQVIGPERSFLGSYPVAMLDFNGDGYQDLLSSSNTGALATTDDVRLYLGPFPTGDRRDGPADALWTGFCLRGGQGEPAIGDYDGDGRDDVALEIHSLDCGSPAPSIEVVYGSESPERLIDLRADAGRLTASIGGLAELGSGVQFHAVAADADGDGRDELVMTDGPLLVALTDAVRAPGRVASARDAATPLGRHGLLAVEAFVREPLSAHPSASCPGDLVIARGRFPSDETEAGQGAIGFLPEPPDFWSEVRDAELRLLGFRGRGASGAAGLIETLVAPDVSGGAVVAMSYRAPTGPGGSYDENGLLLTRVGGGWPARADALLDAAWRLRSDDSAFAAENGLLAVGDWNGDGIEDLFTVEADGVSLVDGDIRVVSLASLPPAPTVSQCQGEPVALAPGESTTLPVDASAATSGGLAVWGRAGRGDEVFGPTGRLEPTPAPAGPTDPRLTLDGEPVAELLQPAPLPGRGLQRGRVEDLGLGVLAHEGDADAGALLACPDPGNRKPLLRLLVETERVVELSGALGDCEAELPLEALAHDPDCDGLRLQWTEGATVLAEGESATASFPVGSHDLEAVASDPFEGTHLPLRVVVLDVTTPSLELSFAAPPLWPPRHDLIELRLGRELRAEVLDNCDPEPFVRIVDVVSSEAEEATGSGPRRGPDASWTEDRVWLRRERSGPGTGRTYVVRIEARDASGNVTMEALFVEVPHDHRRER